MNIRKNCALWIFICTERGNTYQMQIWLEKDLPERFNLEIWFVTYFSNMTKTSNI
nr:MAG TPA: hypothetical protein [Bacteriophage sp.]